MRVYPILEEIFKTQIVTDKYGNTYKFESGISPNKGEFLWSLIQNNDIENSIEIGCACGISSLYICDALSQKASPHHVIVDPYQSTYWQEIGVNNLDKAKFSFYELIEKPSEIALPSLLEEDQEFDFAFIDGDHSFEHVFLDFFYLDHLLRIQGFIVFDDADYAPVTKVIHYIINHYSNYKIIGAAQGDGKTGLKRQSLNIIKTGLGFLAKAIPEYQRREIVDDSILHTDPSLKSRASVIALQKMAPTSLVSRWYEQKKEESISKI